MTLLDASQTTEFQEEADFPALRAVASPQPASLSALEWSVVALARRERPSSIRRPGAIAAAMGLLFGGRRLPALADRRLEALRRLAVLAWHRAAAIDDGEIAAFLGAGFTSQQYELVRGSIDAGRSGRSVGVH